MHLAIGGITPFTTIDFPGCLAAVIFLHGCNWRCTYCHNPHLQQVENSESDRTKLLDFLKSRLGLLDGIVISGGEPLLQSGLSLLISETKELGFKVGLHTAGTTPERLGKVLPLLDWVGLDIKAPFPLYPSMTGIQNSAEKAQLSLDKLLASGVPYEVRTTVDPNWFTPSSLRILAQTLSQKGITHYALQQCRPLKGYTINNPDPLEDKDLIKELDKLFPFLVIRTH